MEPLLSQPGTPLLSVLLTPGRDTPGAPRRQQQLRFPDTLAGASKEMEVELSNISPFPVKWTISSFAPPYLKGSGASNGLFRVTYSVFWLPKLTGILHSQQTEKVVFCFCPRDPGVYSQFWEIKSETQAASLQAQHTSKLELVAEAPANTDQQRVSADNAITTKSHVKPRVCVSSSHQPTKEALSLTPANGCLEFPVTAPHKRVVEKFQLKNCTDQEQHIIIHEHALLPPFHNRHSTVSLRPRHYVRVPIEFRPEKVGKYEGTIIIESDQGCLRHLHLVATCS